MKASLKNYHQSPRKVRLVADLVRGKTVAEARERLKFLPRRAAEPMVKLINSAAAASGVVDKDKLVINHLTVDGGFVFKRYRPRARGRASMIRKRTSHIKVELTARK